MSTNTAVYAPSVPMPTEDPPSIVESIWALKQNVEILTGAHTKYHLPIAPKSSASIAHAVAIDRAKGV